MAELEPQDMKGSGVTGILQAAAAGGDTVKVSNGHYTVVILAENTDTVSQTVTVVSQASNPPPGLVSQDLSVSIPAGEIAAIGIPKDQLNHLTDSDDLAHLSYSNAGSINVGAVERPG